MEKLFFLLAIIGSIVYLLKALWLTVKFLAKKARKTTAAPYATVRYQTKPSLPAQPTHEHKQETDWSVYDTPAFIRRGIPMPKLEPVPVKPKRRRKAKVAVKAQEPVATFEVVA